MEDKEIAQKERGTQIWSKIEKDRTRCKKTLSGVRSCVNRQTCMHIMHTTAYTRVYACGIYKIRVGSSHMVWSTGSEIEILFTLYTKTQWDVPETSLSLDVFQKKKQNKTKASDNTSPSRSPTHQPKARLHCSLSAWAWLGGIRYTCKEQ